MTVNLDSDLVGSSFDAVRRVCFYTAKQGARQWTVEVPLHELHAQAGNKLARRQIVTRYLQSAMNGPDDAEKSKSAVPAAS